MEPTITVKEKLKVTTTRTTEQTVSFLVPLPHWEFQYEIRSWEDKTICTNIVDIKEDAGDLMFKLKLVASEYYCDYKKERYIELTMSTEDAVEMNVTLAAVLLDSDGTPSKRKAQMTCNAFKRTRSWEMMRLPFDKSEEWEDFVQERDDDDESDERNPEHDEHLVMQITMSILYVTLPKNRLLLKDVSKKAGRDWNNAIQRILSSPTFQNVKFICSDGVEVSANKELLAAQCPVFEAMFERSKMREAETGVVPVADVTGSVMTILVEYWQTGKMAKSWCRSENIGGLALAANKYGVEPLMKLLDETLGDESVVASNLKLLEIASKAGYKKAEKSIIGNLLKRAKGSLTRDAFYGAFGIRVEKVPDARSKMDSDQYWDLITNMDKGWEGENCNPVNLQLVADLELGTQEESIIYGMMERLEPVKTRAEFLEVIGLSPQRTFLGEPAAKKIRLDNENE